MFFHFVQAPRENRMKQKVTRNGEFLATSIGGFDSWEKVDQVPGGALGRPVVLFHPYTITSLGGGFKHVLLSPPFGEDSYFD